MASGVSPKYRSTPLGKPPEIPLWRGEENGVPIDDHPARLRHHHISGTDSPWVTTTGPGSARYRATSAR